MAKKPVTFIQAAIPPSRGTARHFERYDDHAATVFDKKGSVEEIHTPQDALRRVHEVMHARHSNPKAYKGRRWEVRNIIEDCRLHTQHWPWLGVKTPEAIAKDVAAIFKDELKRREATMQAEGRVDPFSDFCQKLRMSATYKGMGEHRKARMKYASPAHRSFAEELFGFINRGRHEQAALLLEEAFFGQPENKEVERPKGEDGMDGEGKPGESGGDEALVEGEDGDELERAIGAIHTTMKIVEMPWVEETHKTDRGFRLTTTGSRIYRPALRRPILPHRLFLKQSPIAPGGAILFDASGSMGVDNERLHDCCRRAPSATVAFYSGDDYPEGDGYLYIYAKDGLRANSFADVEMLGGNGCDGLALDWLMQQDGPRIFVTDRGFCGSGDSMIQLVRLTNLEELGEVTVYESYDEFSVQFPHLEAAA